MTPVDSEHHSRVLVTGAAGEIGTVLVPALRSRGFAVTGLSLHEPPDHECDRFIVGDVTDFDAVRSALAGVDRVVHLAAIPHPQQADPYTIFRTNTSGVFNVLEQAAERGVRRAVVASSINASGLTFNPHAVAPAYFPIDEAIPTDIADAYSLSKSVGEQVATMAHRTWGIDTVSIRFPLVKDIEILRENALAMRDRIEWGAREGWGYLDNRDAVRLILLALTVPVRGAHVVCATADDTLIDVPTEAAIATVAPYARLVRAIPGRGAAIDGSRARDLLGFEPEFSIWDDGWGVVAEPEAVNA